MNRPVVDLMREPAVTSERVSQGLLGEAARILERQGEWLRIALERDGYAGWCQAIVLCEANEEVTRSFVAASDIVVVAEIGQAYSAPDRKSPAGKLPFGVNLPAQDQRGDAVALRLPDGRVWWVPNPDVIDRSERPKPDAAGIARALSLALRSVGVPYLWGGRTPFGYDCSGLTQAVWRFLGVEIPRDADQQFQAGKAVEGAAVEGDLLFFAVASSPGAPARFANICHVGVCLGGRAILHASGKSRSVCIDRLESGSSPYTDWLLNHLAGVRRFAPCF